MNRHRNLDDTVVLFCDHFSLVSSTFGYHSILFSILMQCFVLEVWPMKNHSKFKNVSLPVCIQLFLVHSTFLFTFPLPHTNWFFWRLQNVPCRKKITLISIQRKRTKAWWTERARATERPRLESQQKGRASPQSTEPHQGGEASHLIKGDVEAGRAIEGTPDHQTDVEAAHVTEGIPDHQIDAGRRITEEALQETREVIITWVVIVILFVKSDNHNEVMAQLHGELQPRLWRKSS